jgi:hypothetical protein
VLGLLFTASAARAQNAAPPSLEVYGFGMADAIVDFKQNNPDWYDTLRPSRLPNVEDQFGKDGHFYLSPRQSRFGVRSSATDFKAQFEFDMFGVGVDAGQTTIRLRHAWGQYKKIGGGLTNSQFMDIDVFPNTLEYWGPNGMLFLRNTQIFYELMNKPDGSNIRVAIEAPGASGDAGVFADRVELQGVKGRFPAPDFTGHYRMAMKWGYVQIGGALRYIAYDDLIPNDQYDLSGHVWGGGGAISTNVKASPNDVIRAQFTYGAGIENYFNDAPIDVGLATNTDVPQPPAGSTAPLTPVKGEALRDLGTMIYLDHTWNKRFTSSAGYSIVNISNSDLQAANAYKTGQYFSANVLYNPDPNVIMGLEFLYGHRANHSDGFTSYDPRVQFSVKYSFSHKLIGG